MNNSELFTQLKPYILKMLSGMGIVPVVGKGFSHSPHGLSGSDHTGVLADAQAPQFLMRDGSRSLLANLPVALGVTIDGVDLSVLNDNYNTHLSADSHTIYLLANGTRPVVGHLLPDNPDTRDLGSSTQPWRKGYLSELDAVVFAQQTASLVGGWLIIGHDEGILAARLVNTDTTANFGKTMTPGDIVVFRSVGQVEYILVGSLVSGTTYNVTRNLDGSGANNWVEGSVFLVLGTTGDGRIELNAYSTPRIQLLLQGATYNVQTEIVRIGDLAGSYGIATELYGVGIGNYDSGNYLRYDGTNGFLLHAGGDAVMITDAGIRIIAPAAGVPAIPNSIDFVYGADPVASVIGYYSSGGDASGLNLIAQLPAANDTSGSAGVTLTADAQTGVSSNTDAGATIEAKARKTTTGDAVSSSVAASASKTGTSQVRLHTADADAGYGDLYFRTGGVELSRNGSSIPYIKVANDYLPGADGWAPAGETWAYASTTSFTISGNVVAKYPKGTKIKLTQTSVKYFYVVNAVYAGSTTITVTGGSDYSLANAAISDNYLSYMETPQGFPDWFNWSPTLTGYSANPTNVVYRFKVEGRQVTVSIREATNGTSNSGSLTISAPITAATITNMTWLAPVGLVNNGTALTTWGRGRIGSAESVFTFGTDPSIDGGFNSAGTGKRVTAFQINYEM